MIASCAMNAREIVARNIRRLRVAKGMSGEVLAADAVSPDKITCLDCGWSGQMLKRHLTTAHSMTPEQYREWWKLPLDYTMVAPNYASRRSELAKEIGLGTRGRRRAKR